MSMQSSGLNAGYVGQLVERYLENPEAVDPAWREIFESDDDVLLASLPGLEGLLSRRREQAGNGGTP